MGLALLALSIHSGADPLRVPDGLRGTWRTSDVALEDRFIEFRERTIAFGTGGILEEVLAIRGIEPGASPLRGYLRYRIALADADGAASEFLIDHQQQAVVPSLRAQNRSEIWWKDDERWRR